MSDIAIKAAGLGKRYRIGAALKRLRTPQAAALHLLGAPFRHLRGTMSRPVESELIWALRDVSFEVGHGEVIGIVGRNGAGKSTLLRILARITEPTEGWAELRGRLGSLLEVGTGFHSELTGRENIYMSAAILGMRKAEIDRKYDEIVEFSGVEKFLDTPIKRYSSGMSVRLAFAVAAHLEPEIMLVDEVLAVGDVGFQKKCLGKMNDFARQGRTVLFVSHNMGAVTRLCGRAMWLDSGRIKMQGEAESVVSAYLASGAGGSGEARWTEAANAPGSDKLRLRAARLISANGEVSSSLDARYSFKVEIEYEIIQPMPGLQIGIAVVTADGVTVFASGDHEDQEWAARQRPAGVYRSVCSVPGRLLNSGSYYLALSAGVRGAPLLLAEENVLSFDIEQTAVAAHSSARPPGVIAPPLEWRVERAEQ